MTTDRLLVPRKAYFIEIALKLPESELNQGYGIFGVVVELQSTNSTVLAISRRSARMPYTSNWVSCSARMDEVFLIHHNRSNEL
jgi:hypothetical protein